MSTEDGRRRREQNAIALRKDKKEEGLSKRRNLGAEAAVIVEEVAGVQAVKPVADKYTNLDVPRLLVGLVSTDISVQIESLKGFRRLLSQEKNAPVAKCISCGALPLFVAFLQRTDSVELQFEAAWVLTNIASSEHTNAIVKCDAIPHLVNLLLSPNADIREQVHRISFSNLFLHPSRLF